MFRFSVVVAVALIGLIVFESVGRRASIELCAGSSCCCTFDEVREPGSEHGRALREACPCGDDPVTSRQASDDLPRTLVAEDGVVCERDGPGTVPTDGAGPRGRRLSGPEPPPPRA